MKALTGPEYLRVLPEFPLGSHEGLGQNGKGMVLCPVWKEGDGGCPCLKRLQCGGCFGVLGPGAWQAVGSVFAALTFVNAAETVHPNLGLRPEKVGFYKASSPPPGLPTPIHQLAR